MTPSSLFSRKQYIEYQPGTLNVILSVPHGGTLKPDTIPDRDAGYLVEGRKIFDHNSKTKDYVNCLIQQKGDLNTKFLAVELANELEEITGSRPHVVINHLSRMKMDGNRDMDVAAFNVPEAVCAWKSYHNFIDIAKSSIKGVGLFLDIHGHSHSEELVEIGYMLSAKKLDSKEYSGSDTSISRLSCTKNTGVKELIVGEKSFGGLLEQQGYQCIPSPAYPSINGKSYFSGGYNTKRHGSQGGGHIDAIQIETPRVLRQDKTIPAFAKALAKTTSQYLQLYFSD